jgi:hypothetical protein
LATAVVAVKATGKGHGHWSGAPSAWFDGDWIYLAYRVRAPISKGRGGYVVVARSRDGVHFEELCRIHKAQMKCESLERPDLMRLPNGRWRLYVSCATVGSKHWRVELLEADDPADFGQASSVVVMPGDDDWGVKDPVIDFSDGNWRAFATFHPLKPRRHEDRMYSWYATSPDGIAWDWKGAVLVGRPRMWDRRGTSICAVTFGEGVVTAYYNGRGTPDWNVKERYEERLGMAIGSDPMSLAAVGDAPVAEEPGGKGLRYLEILRVPGGHRFYYELGRQDGSHDLMTDFRPD